MVAAKGKTPSKAKAGAAARKPAAGRAARPVAAKPSRKSRASPKTRLVQILPVLDKLFGEIGSPETSSVLEKAVYLILREGGGEPGATRGLEALRGNFIDWNEVRASRPTELASMMTGSMKTAPVRRFIDRARRAREMIDQVYNDRNDPGLEFLLEQKGKEQVEFLADLDDLGPHNAWALAQWLSGEDKLVGVSPELAKAAQKLGLTDSAAVTKVRKELSDLAAKEQLVAIQAHLNQLGAMEEPWPAALSEFLS